MKLTEFFDALIRSFFVARDWVGTFEKQFLVMIALMQLAVAFSVVVFGCFQYLVGVQSGRVTAAMKFLQDQEEGDAMEVAERLNKFWLSDEMQKKLAEVRESPSDKQNAYKDIILPLLESQKEDFHALLRAYRNAALCARSNVCDRKQMCNFTFDNLQSFRETFRPLFLEVEAVNDPAAEEVEYFAEGICRKEFVAYCEQTPRSPYCSPQMFPST